MDPVTQRLAGLSPQHHRGPDIFYAVKKKALELLPYEWFNGFENKVKNHPLLQGNSDIQKAKQFNLVIYFCNNLDELESVINIAERIINEASFIIFTPPLLLPAPGKPEETVSQETKLEAIKEIREAIKIARLATQKTTKR